MSDWEAHEADDDGLRAEERVQLRELCLLIVISEFLETERKTADGKTTSKITKVK
jgi:hypothetical protein